MSRSALAMFAVCACLVAACAPAPDEGAPIPDDATRDCAATFCGCWAPATLTYSVTVVDAATEEPIEGVGVFCLPEEEPIALSDADGLVSFSIDTMESPGCGWERCNNLQFRGPLGANGEVRYAVRQEPPGQSHGAVVRLSPSSS